MHEKQLSYSNPLYAGHKLEALQNHHIQVLPSIMNFSDSSEDQAGEKITPHLELNKCIIQSNTHKFTDTEQVTLTDL